MDTNLAARLAAHDEYFCRVLDLVPSHLYLPKDDAAEQNVKYFKVRKDDEDVATGGGGGGGGVAEHDVVML